MMPYNLAYAFLTTSIVPSTDLIQTAYTTEIQQTHYIG